MIKTIGIGNILDMLVLLATCRGDSEDTSIEEASSIEEITGIWEGTI